MKEDKEFFDKNINALRHFMPKIAEALEDYQPESTLFFHENGGPDVRFRDVTLYGEDARAHCERQVKNYLAKPFRLHLNPPDTESLDDFSNDFIVRLMKRATDADMKFSVRVNDKRSHHLIVYGIGLGLHIPALLEKTKAQNLLLVEPNHEFLYQSLHVLDWSEILNILSERESSIKIIVSNSPRPIADFIRETIRGNNPSALDGTYLFTHYNNSAFLEAQRIFMQECAMIVAGLGFFRDEMGMLTNTFGNLSNGTARIHNKAIVIKDGTHSSKVVPAFIIGSGPSLDKDIEFIMANKEKAVIFSSGTALRPLLTAGIKPDIQVELERGTPPLELLKKLSEEFDLSGITLVASSTIDPRIKEFFDDVIFFFRSALSPYPIFGDKMSVLKIPGPTVANTSLSLAQELGFRTFYTFGVDFGARDPERHHSAASDYYGEMEAEEEKDYGTPLPANFGGMVFTGHILQWAKDALEASIERYPINTYYNCSDGVSIERMIPILSETIKPLNIVDKAKVIETLREHTPIYDQGRFLKLWRNADILSELEHLAQALCEVTEDEKLEDYLRIVGKTAARLIFDTEEETPSSVMIYRGTIFMVLMVINYYSSRLTDLDRLGEFRQIVAEEYRAEVETMRDVALETMRELDKTLPESDDAEGTVISFG